MNETLTLVLALAGGRLARRDFLRRSLVDGPEGRFVRTAGALVPRQPAAANESLPWPDFTSSHAVIGQRLLVCLLGFVIARLVVTRLTRPAEDANSLGKGGQPCALVPMS